MSILPCLSRFSRFSCLFDRRLRFGLVGLVLALLLATSAAAEDGSPAREASRHFARAVALYGETDYGAALVEFERAYAIAPNVAVLYNVGETEYQLQDYAKALTTFERYLAEASPGESRRAEVESDVEVLRARVGHLAITTSPTGADVTVDDQAIGRTPLEKPLLVSVGRRKVVASLPGRAPVARYVDVAAGDDAVLALDLPLPEPPVMPAEPLEPSRLPLPRSRVETPAPARRGGGLRVAGWVFTGASAAGAIAAGVLAMKASNDLSTARGDFPTSAATLNHDASLVTTYSVLADSLAAAAIVVGGITLYSTLSSSSPEAAKPANGERAEGTRRAMVSVGPGSARFEMTF